jgi:hypothetical protein
LRHCRQAISASQKYRGAIISLHQKRRRYAGTLAHFARWAACEPEEQKSHQEEKRQQEETDYAEPRNPD